MSENYQHPHGPYPFTSAVRMIGSCVGLFLKLRAKRRRPAFGSLLIQPQFQSQTRIQKCPGATLNSIDADIKVVPAVLRIDHSAEPEDSEVLAFSSAKLHKIAGH